MVVVKFHSIEAEGKIFGFFYSYDEKSHYRKKSSGKKFKEVMKSNGYLPATAEDKKFLLKNIPDCFKKRMNEFDYDILLDDDALYCHAMAVKK